MSSTSPAGGGGGALPGALMRAGSSMSRPWNVRSGEKMRIWTQARLASRPARAVLRGGEAPHLLERQLACVLARSPARMPVDDRVERRLEVPARRPPEQRASLGGVELQVARLMRS